MGTNNFHFHRVLRAKPEVVYKAFIDPEAKVKWLPPDGYTAKVHHIDARAGGTYKMSFTHLGTGQSHTFGGTYLELIPGYLLRYTDQFDDPNLPGEITVTVTFKAVSCGTELHIAQDGVPDVIAAEMCHLGWQDSLALLTRLVEGT